MDKKTVYIETSIISYLTARPSSDLLAAAWQKVTLTGGTRNETDLTYTPQELLGVYENG